jgi:hypothetical protein
LAERSTCHLCTCLGAAIRSDLGGHSAGPRAGASPPQLPLTAAAAIERTGHTATSVVNERPRAGRIRVTRSLHVLGGVTPSACPGVPSTPLCRRLERTAGRDGPSEVEGRGTPLGARHASQRHRPRRPRLPAQGSPDRGRALAQRYTRLTRMPHHFPASNRCGPGVYLTRAAAPAGTPSGTLSGTHGRRSRATWCMALSALRLTATRAGILRPPFWATSRSNFAR